METFPLYLWHPEPSRGWPREKEIIWPKISISWWEYWVLSNCFLKDICRLDIYVPFDLARSFIHLYNSNQERYWSAYASSMYKRRPDETAKDCGLILLFSGSTESDTGKTCTVNQWHQVEPRWWFQAAGSLRANALVEANIRDIPKNTVYWILISEWISIEEQVQA